jgi:DNA-binding transcriptional LysR family regulator
LNFQDLECFVVAAEELNFTRAAHRLYISQQSLSAHISKLEQHYQTKLFERTSPLTLTSAGASLLEYAKNILILKERTEAQMQEIRRAENNILTIGILSNRGTVLIQSILPRLRAKYPEISLKILEFPDENFSAILNSGAVDLMLGYCSEPSHIAFIPLLAERYYLLVSDHILHDFFTPTQQKEILSGQVLPISFFRSCPFLASSSITWLKEIFEKCCLEIGLIPDIMVETSSFLTRVSLCIAGFGVMFISGSLVTQCKALLDKEQLQKLHFIKLEYQPDPVYCTLGINYLKQKKLSAASRKFIQIARQTFPFQDSLPDITSSGSPPFAQPKDSL